MFTLYRRVNGECESETERETDREERNIQEKRISHIHHRKTRNKTVKLATKENVATTIINAIKLQMKNKKKKRKEINKIDKRKRYAYAFGCAYIGATPHAYQVYSHTMTFG